MSDQIKRISFEDNGQDFLFWDIDESGNIINCGPFQASTWVGGQVKLNTLNEGENLELKTKHGMHMYLKHRTEKIESIEHTTTA